MVSYIFQKMITTIDPDLAKELKIGLHMLRKTGYLFAIWGNGDWNIIKQDARHVHDDEAQKYATDAYASKEIAMHANGGVLPVAPYKPSYCKNPNVATYHNKGSNAYGVPLCTLSKEYVDGTLGVHKDHQGSLKHILGLAMKDKPSQSVDEERKKFMHSLSEKQRSFFESYERSLHDAMSKERKKNSQMRMEGTNEDDDESCNRKRSGSHTLQEEENEKKKSRTEPDNNLTSRLTFASLKTVSEKMDLLHNIEKKMEVDNIAVAQLTKAATTFVKRTLRPALKCLRNHHNNDKTQFCNYWEKKFLVKFGESCCCGSGNKCKK